MEAKTAEWTEDQIWKEEQEARRQEKKNQQEGSEDDSDLDVDNFLLPTCSEQDPGRGDELVSCRRKAETFTSVTEQTANTSAKTATKTWSAL